MPRCPICQSARIIVMAGIRPRARCVHCGALWIQQGSEQRSVRSAPVPVRDQRV